jgi:hypothetical protein
MRRIAAILALVVMLAVAGPADAHPLVNQAEVPVGRTVSVTISVPGETESPMVGVDVVVPPAFHLDHPAASAGWTPEVAGSTVRFRGGPLPLGGFSVFTLTGEISKRGVMTIPVTTISADGKSVDWEQRGLAPRVYAGVKAPNLDGGSGGSPSPLAWVGRGLVALGVVGALVLLVRRRRIAVDA